MAMNWNATAKNSRMSAGLAQIDANASPASLEIGTAGFSTTIVGIPLTKPSFSLSADTLSLLNAPRAANATAGGIAALARIKDGGGTIVLSGLTVGTSGADINLNSTNISSGQQVSITALTLQHAP